MTYTLIYKTCATEKDATREKNKLPNIASSPRVEYSRASASYLVILFETVSQNKAIEKQQEFFRGGVPCFIKVSK